jgi:hypothetical protein
MTMNRLKEIQNRSNVRTLSTLDGNCYEMKIEATICNFSIDFQKESEVEVSTKAIRTHTVRIQPYRFDLPGRRKSLHNMKLKVNWICSFTTQNDRKSPGFQQLQFCSLNWICSLPLRMIASFRTFNYVSIVPCFSSSQRRIK